ncbi:MAG: ABC transporter permease [Acidobacteriales bacterium]|nr:ABC transporter permease [Terriglobales bacterium]
MQSRASFAEAASVAVASLRSSKLRSFLTLLGIILATTTLIAVMSVIHGMDVYIAQNLSNMGSEGFKVRRIVMIGQFNPKKFMEMQKRNPQLTEEEYQFIRSRATMVRDFGMEAYRSASVTCAHERIEGVQMQGATSNVGVIQNIQAVNGRFLADSDDQRRQAVTFIGNDIRERCFTGVDPIGKYVEIEGRPFRVVGVGKPQGSVFGESLDNYVIIPIQTFFKMYGSRNGIGFCGVAMDQTHLFQAQDEVRMLMRAHRHMRPNQEDNFGLANSDSLVSAWDRLTGAIAATAIAVVSVFMVVGGVVIMNIMLAVVTERTHEIGIRKSVGARKRDILNQFLVESSLLAAVGGAVGVGTAWIIGFLVSKLTPVPMSMPLSAVLISLVLSTAVGLFFGIYPAQRAARLDPIAALRMER